jgi:peptidylprolyl isomerase
VTGLILPQPKVNDVRRLAALLGILSLLFGLAACGDDAGANADDGTGGAGLDAVTVTGDLGKAPEVKWNDTVDVDKTETKTLIAGDGDKLAKGDTALVHIWIGNGFSKEKAYSTYDEGAAQTLAVDDTQILKGLYAGVVDQTVGSRVLVVSPPADAFGDTGNPTLGIADTDNVVFIVDIINKVLDKPEGTPQKAPANAPLLNEKDGTPTGFDFSKAPKKPSDKLQVYTLIKGNGPKVASGDNTSMNYLGMVYGSDKIFDQSYGRAPFSTKIGAGQVIKGWDQGLVGVPVGSRVMLVIPPDLAYGEKGSGDTIPPNSTLVFVVDVLAAY